MLMLRLAVAVVEVVGVCARVEAITLNSNAVRKKFAPIQDTQQRSDITHVISQQFVICAKYKVLPRILEWWRFTSRFTGELEPGEANWLP